VRRAPAVDGGLPAEERGELEPALRLYRAELKACPRRRGRRAGAAAVLEAQGKAAEARGLWDEVRAGAAASRGWMEGTINRRPLVAAR